MWISRAIWPRASQLNNAPSQSPVGRGLIARWLPVVAWMALVFVASSQTTLPGLPHAAADAVLKKLGHAAAYAVLAVFAERAIRAEAKTNFRTLVAAFTLCIAYASADEFHQSFVPARTARLADVVIDSLGAALGCSIALRGTGVSARAFSLVPHDSNLRQRLIAAVLLSLVSIIWGGSFIAARIALREVSPITLATVRFVLAGVFFAWLLLVRPHYRAPARELAKMTFFGLLAVTFYFIFQYNGVERTSASLSAMVITLSPLVVVALSVLFLRDRLTSRQMLGVALATAGAVVLVTNGYLEIGGSDYWLGVFYLILNVLAWGVYNIIGKRTLSTLHPTTLTSYMMVTGAIALVPFGLADGGWRGLAALSSGTWMAIAYLVILCTIAAYLAYNFALQLIPASQAGVFLYLNPVAAVIIANIVLGEPFTALTAMGGVLAIAGVYLANRDAG